MAKILTGIPYRARNADSSPSHDEAEKSAKMFCSVVDSKDLKELGDRFVHLYGQTDGTFRFPNSVEGDLLKLVAKALNIVSPGS